MQPIGILGGSFDPIHLAHLRAAIEVRELLDLREVRFIPSARPPHRGGSVASATERVEMLRLAIAGDSGLIIDERELKREGPSYTYYTLESLRAENPDTPLCLIIGADQFVAFDTWHRWREIFQLAHLAVLYRPGWNPTGQIANRDLAGIIREHTTADPRRLRDPAGGMVFFAQVSQFDLSSSHIRALVQQGKSARFLVPDAVWDYIRNQGLYSKQSGGM